MVKSADRARAASASRAQATLDSLHRLTSHFLEDLEPDAERATASAGPHDEAMLFDDGGERAAAAHAEEEQRNAEEGALAAFGDDEAELLQDVPSADAAQLTQRADEPLEDGTFQWCALPTTRLLPASGASLASREADAVHLEYLLLRRHEVEAHCMASPLGGPELLVLVQYDVTRYVAAELEGSSTRASNRCAPPTSPPPAPQGQLAALLSFPPRP